MLHYKGLPPGFVHTDHKSFALIQNFVEIDESRTTMRVSQKNKKKWLLRFVAVLETFQLLIDHN